jgi:hypothetical protein
MPDRPSADRRTACLFFGQDAEKARQRRSRIVQILNVPQRARLRSSLAAVLLSGLFEHPAGVGPLVLNVLAIKFCYAEKGFRSLLSRMEVLSAR